MLADFPLRDSGDIEQGNALDTEDRLLSGLFKADYTLHTFHTLKFQAQIFDNDGQELNNGTAAVSASNPIVDERAENHQFSLKYAFDNPANRWMRPKLHLHHNETDMEEEDRTGGNAGRVQTRGLETLGFTIDTQTVWAPDAGHRHTLSYGFEVYRDEQVSKSSATSDGKRGGVPDAEATNLGFYLQDEVALDTLLGDVLLIPALRFDHYESDVDGGHSQNGGELYN